MKTKKIEKKLTLDKCTVSNLTQDEKKAVKGGEFVTKAQWICDPTGTWC